MKIIYHKADLDGIFSGAIVKEYAKPDKYPTELIGIDYGMDIKPIVYTDEKVYIVDFMLEPFTNMRALANMCEVIWIDHHQSSLNNMNELILNPFYHVVLGDNTKSAAELCWDYFNPNIESSIGLKYISKYDTWQHNNDPNILNFQYGARAYIESPSDIDQIRNVLNGDQITFIDYLSKGSSIRHYMKSFFKRYAEDSVFEINFEGYKALALNMGYCGSNAFDSCLKPEHDIMIAFVRKDGYWKYSLYRNKDSINCFDIAQKYGGGGHAGAAGFETKELLTNFI